MKSKKLVTFKRDKIVQGLDEKALAIVNAIIEESEERTSLALFKEEQLESWDDYEQSIFNYAFNSLKKKRKEFYLGRITMLMEFVVDFDVFINKRAHGFLSYMNSFEG